MLVYDEMVPRYLTLSRIAIVTGILPRRDSEIKKLIVRMAKTYTILKRHVNKLFRVKNRCHGTSQTDKVRWQKLRREAAVIGELKIKYEC